MINNKKCAAIIPARYPSTRFPGKPLVMLAGKTMIERVVIAAKASKYLDEIYVATDDERIIAECNRIGVGVIMTPAELPSGTDRVNSAVKIKNIDAEYIMNLQGDEPLIKAEHFDSAIEALDKSNADVATLMKKIDDINELISPNIVKIALDKNRCALYFSRSTIPCARDLDIDTAFKTKDYYKHIGIYVYTKKAIQRFSELPESYLELTEKLEQLRLVEDGAKFLCVEIFDELVAIDTPDDVAKVLARL